MENAEVVKGALAVNEQEVCVVAAEEHAWQIENEQLRMRQVLTAQAIDDKDNLSALTAKMHLPVLNIILT